MHLFYALILILLHGFSLSNEHPIHVSKCQVEHDLDSKHLQVTMHVFIDDLEESIRLDGSDSLYLGTEFESQDAIDKIDKYLKEHFSITLDGRTVELEFLGKEMSDDYMAFWCFLESKEPVKEGKLEIQYDVIMDLYSDQRNILNLIRLDRSEEYELLHVNKKTVELGM